MALGHESECESTGRTPGLPSYRRANSPSTRSWGTASNARPTRSAAPPTTCHGFALTAVHAPQQVLLEGLAQALPLFLTPDDSWLTTRVRLAHYVELVRAELHLAVNAGVDIAECAAHARARVPFWTDARISDQLSDRGADPLLRSYLWAYPAGLDWFVRPGRRCRAGHGPERASRGVPRPACTQRAKRPVARRPADRWALAGARLGPSPRVTYAPSAGAMKRPWPWRTMISPAVSSSPSAARAVYRLTSKRTDTSRSL